MKEKINNIKNALETIFPNCLLYIHKNIKTDKKGLFDLCSNIDFSDDDIHWLNYYKSYIYNKSEEFYIVEFENLLEKN